MKELLTLLADWRGKARRVWWSCTPQIRGKDLVVTGDGIPMLQLRLADDGKIEVVMVNVGFENLVPGNHYTPAELTAVFDAMVELNSKDAVRKRMEAAGVQTFP